MMSDDVIIQNVIPWLLGDDVELETFDGLVDIGQSNLRAMEGNWKEKYKVYEKEESLLRYILKEYKDKNSWPTQSCNDKAVGEALMRWYGVPREAALAIAIGKKRKAEDAVKVVRRAITESEDKPCFSRWRSLCGWFAVGDDVVAFTAKGEFVPGKITMVYGFNDFKVSIMGDYVYSSYYPMVMKPWEYDYLKAHPDYKKLWMKASMDRDPAHIYALQTCLTAPSS